LARRGRQDAIDQLEGPPFPDELAYLWEWFVELDRARGSTGFAMSPIGFVDIQAWASLTGRRPYPEEVHALLQLDWTKRHPPEDPK